MRKNIGRSEDYALLFSSPICNAKYKESGPHYGVTSDTNYRISYFLCYALIPTPYCGSTMEQFNNIIKKEHLLLLTDQYLT